MQNQVPERDKMRVGEHVGYEDRPPQVGSCTTRADLRTNTHPVGGGAIPIG
ncbi:MAG TPA: hypothetical protein VE422_09570 [Terriglobia bacterium]|nr:hypothetical protein [Terriglobia bacterium]